MVVTYMQGKNRVDKKGNEYIENAYGEVNVFSVNGKLLRTIPPRKGENKKTFRL